MSTSELRNSSKNCEMEVNLLAAAREAQWSAASFMGPHVMKLVSPAKVNLMLSVGAVRSDGYHEVDTIMHSLALHDVLYLSAEKISEDELAQSVEQIVHSETASCNSSEDAALLNCAIAGPADNLVVNIDLADRTGANVRIPASLNIVCKAADQLARALHWTTPCSIQLRIEKHIPAEGGLGGGSSNAAAALYGLAHSWDVSLDDERLRNVAARLGADVMFFLHGGCTQLEGTGETYKRSLVPSRQALVLVKPRAGVSTAAAYRNFDESPQAIPAEVLAANACAESADDVVLANNLAPVAEALLPELVDINAWLAEQVGSDRVLLCGSGSTTFALTDSFEQASKMATEATKRGWWARPTNLSSLRVAQVPRR